jgi:hypothetical protein
MPDANSFRPRLWLLISCGWSVRNYLRSDFLQRMRSVADVSVWMPDGDPRLEDELRQAGIDTECLPPARLPRKLEMLNGLLVQADNHRLGYWDPHLWKWSVALQPVWKRPYHMAQRLAAEVTGATLLHPLLLRLERHWLRRKMEDSPYAEAFHRARPDLVLSTNPYSLQELFVSHFARRAGIPVLAAIVSWDNLCYKGHLWSDYDGYIIWGPAMRKDLKHHLPSLPEDRIIETGSPQFDFHRRSDLEWSREEFNRRIGAGSGRALITWGANVEWLFPDEPDVVAGLWKAIRDGAIPGRPQLLVRVHPHDVADRFEAIRQECPGLLVQHPCSHLNGQYWWFTPDVEELALLSNTLRYSDVTVNLASSMTLDAAIFDKPVINVAYSTKPDHPHTRRIPFAHLSAHYRKVAESGAVKIAYSIEELVRWINRYLVDPSKEREERRNIVHTICGPMDGRAVDRIAEALSRRMGVSSASARVKPS